MNQLKSGVVTPEQIEFANRSRLITRLFELGFDVFVPIIDRGVDLLAYRAADRTLRQVQLKTRWTIDRKYVGRDIWIAFPADNDRGWFLAPHDELVSVGEKRGYCKTKSWIEKGLYHLAPLGQELRETMDQWLLRTER